MDQVVRKQKSKWVAFILAVLLPAVGAHKFYLGHPKLGVLYLIYTLCLGAVVIALSLPEWTIISFHFPAWIGLVEGVIYILKSPDDFQRIYVEGGRKML